MTLGPRLFHVAVPGFVQSRAFRCIWLLEELDIPDFEVCMLEPKSPYAPQMREFGVTDSHKVPTLQLDGLEVGESGVICQVLAETYQPALLGTSGERLELLQWIAMAETCITFRLPLLPTVMDPASTLEDLQAKAIAPMREVFRQNIARFEAHFEKRGTDFLLQSGFSIADTMCGWSLYMFDHWKIMDLATGESPLTLAYLSRLRERPAFQAAERYGLAPPGRYRRGAEPLSA